MAIVFAETGLLIGFFLPGDSLLITAGLFAARGDFDIRLLVPSLTLAAIAGNATGYAIGKRTGKALYSRPDSLLFRREHLRMTHEYYEKHGGKTIIIAQFIPILRTFAPVVAGVGEMGYTRFATYNVVGAILWVGSMTLAGYALGSLVPNIEQRIHYVVAMVIADLAAAPGNRLAPQPQAQRLTYVVAGLQARLSDSHMGGRAHPLQIRLRPRIGRNHQEFRQFVGVQLPQARLERRQAIRAGLDHHLLLGLLLHRAFPPVDRGHRRQHVHARGQPLLHQRARHHHRLTNAERREHESPPAAPAASLRLYFLIQSGTRTRQDRADFRLYFAIEPRYSRTQIRTKP